MSTKYLTVVLESSDETVGQMLRIVKDAIEQRPIKLTAVVGSRINPIEQSAFFQN